MTDKKRVDRTQRFSHTAMTMAMGAALSMMFTSAMAQTQKDEDVERMDEVVVQERAEQPGTTVITEEELRMTPNAQGTVRDALRTKSFIAFDGGSRTAGKAGEIYSSKISIRGSRPYENRYTINGLSNTNSLKPADWNGGQCWRGQPGGDEQNFMLSDELVSEIDVMSENVSAEYGDFTGGTVNARIRDAAMDGYHGKVWARHSGDSMTVSSDGYDFDRTNAGVRVEGPLIKDKLAGMVSFERIKSKAPDWAADSEGNLYQTQSDRINDNLLVKVNTNAKEDHYASLTFLHAPFTHKYPNPNGTNARFDFEGGGWDLMLNTRHRFDFGVWRNDMSYSYNEINRDMKGRHNFYWWANKVKLEGQDDSEAIATGHDREGWVDDQTMERKAFQYKTALDLKPVTTGSALHHLKVGGEVLHERTHADATAYSTYMSSKTDRFTGIGLYTPDVVGEYDDGVIAGQQFADQRIDTPAASRVLSATHLAAFVEDRIEIDRVTVRPGIRASWDTITHDVNVAPRLFANVDILNDGRFNVNGGYNRYYGTIIQSNALMSMVKGNADIYTRTMNEDGTLTDWKFAKGQRFDNDRIGDVKTPYSDEFTIGASAEVLNGTLFDITAVKRNYRDQLRSRAFSPDGGEITRFSPYEFFNGGKTDYQGITLSVAKAFDMGQWGTHRFDFGVTKAKIEGNMIGFDRDYNSGAASTVVIDGKEVPMEDLPAGNFNPEWTLTFSHTAGFFHDRLRTMALMRYESGCDHLFIDPKSPDRFNPNYFMGKSGSKFNFDLSAQYDLFKMYGTTVTVSVEALNILNKDNVSNTTAYDMSRFEQDGAARQFFVGLSAEF